MVDFPGARKIGDDLVLDLPMLEVWECLISKERRIELTMAAAKSQ